MKQNTNTEAAKTVQTTDSPAAAQERLVRGFFTPGPWVCDPPIKGHDHINVWAKDGIGHIAAVSTELTPDPSAVSNAQLIAAAPKMLKALQFYAAHMKLGSNITDSGQVAEDAIRQALSLPNS